MTIHYGGIVTNTEYVGGETYKFEHVDYKLVGLESEEFDDSDSEYDYRIDQDQDEDEEEYVTAENDDWVFQGEELVDNVVKEAEEGNKGEAKVQDSNVEGLRVDDIDIDD
ncbi:hypothetical protein Salat_1190300 [Sesamum alatum]|uniref:Uncharacterized protein n=1 Tax=Sesamum alatum TaxID=300844 RepID=A0AAE1YEX8_9LAMI|nr:hypothetical protein Salat_1190300 [Sesamum alatum]